MGKKNAISDFKYNKVVLDANVLFGALTRDLLLTLAEARLFVPIWSEKIFNEVERNLIEKRKGVNFKYIRQELSKTFPNSLVKNFEWREKNLNLPDEKDVHVLALAIESISDAIVTNNLKDFPNKLLKIYRLLAIGCDKFLSELVIYHDIIAIEAIEIMRKRFKNPSYTIEELIVEIRRIGLKKTANEIVSVLSLLKKRVKK